MSKERIVKQDADALTTAINARAAITFCPPVPQMILGLKLSLDPTNEEARRSQDELEKRWSKTLVTKMASDYPIICGLLINPTPPNTIVNPDFFKSLNAKFPDQFQEYQKSYASIYQDISKDIGIVQELSKKITSTDDLNQGEFKQKFMEIQTKYMILMHKELTKTLNKQTDCICAGMTEKAADKLKAQVVFSMDERTWGLIPNNTSRPVLDRQLVKQTLDQNKAVISESEKETTARCLEIERAATTRRNAELERLVSAAQKATSTSRTK